MKIPNINAELTVQVLVAHLVGHVTDEQRLGGILGGCLVKCVPGTTGTATVWITAPVVLHVHPPALEDLVVQRVDGLVRVLLRGKLDVAETLAQAPVVRDDAGSGDLTDLGELGLELRRGHFEEEVADVERRALGGLLLERVELVGSLSRRRSSRPHVLGCIGEALFGLGGDVRSLLGNSLSGLGDGRFGLVGELRCLLGDGLLVLALLFALS